jgi:two-component system nitrate/nitrite response regulator NarL
MRAAQETRPIRVLVADNSAIHSELLSEALGRDRRFTVVGSATNSTEIHHHARQSMPDVLLISASLDDKPEGGLDVLAESRAAHPRLKTVVLLESPKREIIIQAFRLGARGVFSRNSPVKVLGKCISCVQGGQIWASSQELGFLLEALAIAPAVRPLDSVGLNQLSARELEVVNCLAEGMSNQEIAQRLKLSRHTIKNYMFRIFNKVGVSSRVELLFYALSRPASENDHLIPTERKPHPNTITLSSNGQQLSPGESKTDAISRRHCKKNGRSREPEGASQLSAIFPRLASA